MANGYEIHGGKLRVYFRFNGMLCREPLGLAPTQKNIEYAASLVATINHQISNSTFEYAQYFPKSKQLDHNKLKTWVATWLDIKARQVAPSTIANYERWCRGHILPKWGECQANSIDAIDVEAWISEDLCNLSSKSIKEIISIMRMVYVLYRKRNHSAANPTDGVKIGLPDDDEPDAFTIDEINQILSTPTHKQSELNAAKFAFWSGARPSEWLALSWDDVNLKTREASFARAVVMGSYKATKTKRSKRRVDLMMPAVQALAAQYEITGKRPAIKIDVLQRDNRTIRTETFRPVFISSANGEPYSRVKYYDKTFWQAHLKNAEVRHRGVSICRHSFASHMLSKGMDVRWICDQLGHSSDTMLRRKYGKYFKQEREINPADLADKAFGFA